MTGNIVLFVTGPNDSDRDLRAAISMCAACDAHLSVLIVAIAAPPPIGDYAAAVSDAWHEERQRDLDGLAAREADVSSLLEAAQVSREVATVYCELSWAEGEVGTRASYADVVLVGEELSNERSLRTSVINGTLFNSSAPLLVASGERSPALDPKVVLLAWDSSLEASRAVRHALGPMKAAGEVHVTLVDPKASESVNGEEPGADIATYLARHGVNVTVDRVSSGGRPVAETLKQQAADIGADLIVMGAYGHSRLRERIFGGVTHDMLEHPAVPVLMAR